MNTAAPPFRRKRINPIFWGLPVAAGAMGIAAFVMLRGSGAVGLTTAWHTAAERALDVTVRKDGELQAVNNIDILSEVEGAVAITSIVKEGVTVKKGDVLVELDSSAIRQRIDDTTLDVQTAETAVVAAREALEIQKSQNDTNQEAADATFKQATIQLTKYNEGDYPLALETAKSELKMAQINLDNTQRDFEQVQQLYSQGYLTKTDLTSREVSLLTAQNAVNQKKAALNNLTSFDRESSLAALESARSQAEARVIRVRRENTANLTQRETDLKTRNQQYVLQKRKLEHLQEQLAACTIKAPEDGLVVYGTSGDRNAQAQIQEGAQVRERQLLLRLPDTSKMKAVVRIQEAQVTKLREGQMAVVNISGVNRPITGKITKISVLADSGQRWWNPDLKEYPVDIELDDTPPNMKPGVGATTEIYIARMESTLAIPVSTIYGSGQKSYVFKKPPTPEGTPVPVEVRLGQASDTYVQVREGVKAGEDILILQAGQGRELLAKAGIAEDAATRPSFGNGGGRRRGGGGGPGGGAGGPGGQQNEQQPPSVPGAPNAPASNEPPHSPGPGGPGQGAPAQGGDRAGSVSAAPAKNAGAATK